MSDATTVNQSTHAALPARARVSYGWVMVAVAALAMVATLPGRTHGLGMITERLLSDPALNLSRTGYGQINLWATLLGSLFCLGIGSGIDRYGVRVSLAAVMFALGGVVLAMTRVTSIPMLFAAILLTRGLGQSALSVVSITIVGKWFDRRVSLPMAVYSVLMAGGFIAAALLGRNCAELDWRDFWTGIGWSVFGLAILLTLIARNRPSPAAPDRGDERIEEIADGDFTHRHALRTPMFWVCSLGISLYGMIVAGVSLFNESILVDQGFPKEVYYESLAMGTAVGVAAKLGAGVLGIYCPLNRLLSAALLLLTGSLIWLTQLVSYRDVVCYVVLNATAGGMLTVLFFSTWPTLYGRAELGRIQGTAQMMTVLASAFGPLMFAQTKEATGSYEPLLWILAGVVFATAAVAWLVPLPRRRVNFIEGQ